MLSSPSCEMLEGMLLSLLKTIGAPGSTAFLAICLGLGVILLAWPRTRRVGRTWLVVILTGYLFLSLPWVANAIAGHLPVSPKADPQGLRTVDALLVFDGDNRRGRVREAGQVYALAQPREVWLLGEPWMLDELVDSGIPASRLKHDPAGWTTLDQLVWVRTRFAQTRDTHVAIVASRLQMPRIAALCRRARLDDVTLVASPIDREPPTSGIPLFVPTEFALRVSRDALYEHAALVYHRN